MAHPNIVTLTQDTFSSEVLQAQTPVLVDFWAPWCGPCKMIGPVLDEIAKESNDRYRITKVNIDDNPALQQRFAIRGVPTLLFFSGGKLQDQIVGVVPKRAIVEKLE